MKDPYEILGVPSGAGSGELKKAFRRLARERHPDTDPDNPWAEDDFKDLSAAYDLLSDPQRRGRFDRGEITGDWTRDPRPRRSKSHPSRPQGTAKQPNPKKPAGPKAAKRSKTAGLKIKGADVEYTLHVEFLEAARGGVRHINMANGKRLKVTIPAGTEDGCVLRLKGQGMLGIGGGADGNAYVEILVDPDPVFRREKNHIHVDVPVTLQEAVLGGRIEAPTIDGVVKVTVPKGSNTGTQLRLKNKGVKSGDKGGKRGDQFIRLQVVLPKKPDQDFVKFLEEWSPGHDYKVREKTPSKASGKGGKK